MVDQLYPWLRAAHLCAALLWLAGMLLAALALRAASTRADAGIAVLALRWDRRATVPAMAATWALGLWLAVEAGWFTAPWLMAKLALVVLLSALHGGLAGRLRRQAEDAAPDMAARFGLPLLLLAAPAVVFLAMVKPF
ncbi:CopD family protein [Marinibaculum pumilum]|uniref:Protoporphyrinogen IX oxidase n=1 Tax=Marinibaculum pumilum TaxID=1766165 RepID=A0ABV7KZD2_9PROT